MMNSKQAAAVAMMVAAFSDKAEAMAALKAAFGGQALPAGDRELAALVKATAARATGAGLFVDKVWVSAIVDAIVADGYDVDVAEFKARLVVLHQGSYLSMSRCDLVEAFPAAIVDASQVEWRRCQWHFVRLA